MSSKPALLSLHQAIQDFFEKYLTIERNASRNTILAYRDAFKLFLHHASEKHVVEIDRLDFTILELNTVRSFLDWLERVRASSPRSRNQRLAGIKTFARYLASVAPEHLERCRRIREMPPASFERPEVEYLEIDEMARLLAAAGDDPRNRALLVLLYNTGARVQELVDLDLADLRLDPVPVVTDTATDSLAPASPTSSERPLPRRSSNLAEHDGSRPTSSATPRRCTSCSPTSTSPPSPPGSDTPPSTPPMATSRSISA